MICVYLLCGVVVDAFNGYRHKKEFIEKNMSTRCYICDINRSWFDNMLKGFDDHITYQHNLWNYFDFIYGIGKMDESKLSGVVKHISKQVKANLISWIPSSRALVLEKRGVYSERGLQLDAIVNALKELEDTLDPIYRIAIN